MLKSTVRAIAPAPLLHAWRRFAFEVEQLRDRGRSLDQVFFDVYAKGKWGAPSNSSPFFSGIGSLPAATARYEAWVAGYFEKNSETQRAGGYWLRRLSGGIERILKRLSRPVRYIGCDIASNVVAHNNDTFAAPSIEFRQLDITRDEPPSGDIVTIRQVLQHLSNDSIARALDNLRTKFKVAIITESVPIEPAAANLDMDSGRWTRDYQRSGVYVDLPTFNLAVLEEHRTLQPSGHMFRSTLVSLG